MKMKKRLRVIALIPLFLSLIIILAVFWANHEIRSSREISRTGDKIVEKAFELNLTMDEYLLYPGERPKIQFQTIHNSVEKSLETIQIRTVEERDISNACRRITYL